MLPGNTDVTNRPLRIQSAAIRNLALVSNKSGLSPNCRLPKLCNFRTSCVPSLWCTLLRSKQKQWISLFAKRMHLPNSREEKDMKLHESPMSGYCSLVPHSASRTPFNSLNPATITAIAGAPVLTSLSIRRGSQKGDFCCRQHTHMYTRNLFASVPLALLMTKVNQLVLGVGLTDTFCYAGVPGQLHQRPSL